MFVRPSGRFVHEIVSAAEYAALAVGLLPFVALPTPLALQAARALGRLAAKLSPRYVRRAEQNLRAAFPDRPERWIRHTARACFEHFGQAAIENLKLPRSSDLASYRRVVSVPDEERVLALAREKKGIIFTGGHLGNWELAARWGVVHGIPVTSVVHRLKNARVDRLISRERSSRGNTTVQIHGAFRRMVRALRRGGVAALLTDRNPRNHGILVPFFGRPILTVAAPALLACATGAPIVPFACLREGRALRYTLHFGEALHADLAAPREREVERLTVESTRALESFIRRAPEQWQWMHRRWKLTPGGLKSAGVSLMPESTWSPDAPHSPVPFPSPLAKWREQVKSDRPRPESGL